MVFNSLIYAVFLPVVLAIYYRLGQRQQNAFLLLASYVFYGWWDWRFLSLIWFSTGVDFLVARRIQEASEQPVKKRWLQLSLLVNLGLLALFKYFGFFADSFQVAAGWFGWHPGDVTLNIVLPVGISFYTFQTLAYTIDVYRGSMKPTRNLLDFALYVSFFPQLVAGPIERAQTLLPQLENERVVSLKDLRVGIALITIGLLRKVGIADAVAGEVNRAFGDPSNQSTLALILSLYLFSFQIYGDFAGYSSIARGSSRLLGVNLMRNFDQPYLSTSITEFWRRWHRSLSFWLRDYLYITLGGNRGGTLFTYRNLMLTMLIGGLWHGASWTFVVWGGLHGLGLAIHKAWMGEARKATADWSTPTGIAKALLGLFTTFHLVVLSWLFFRADSLENAWDYLWSMAYGPFTLGLEWDLWWRVIVYGGLMVGLDILQWRAMNQTPMLSWSAPMRVMAMAFVLIWLLMLGGIDADVEFIYFQF